MAYMVVMHDDNEFALVLSKAISLFEEVMQDNPEEREHFKQMISELKLIKRVRSSGLGKAVCIDMYYRSLFAEAKSEIADAP